MPVSATVGRQLAFPSFDYRRRMRVIRLDITGLVNGANVIPHGLLSQQQGAVTVLKESVELTSFVVTHRTQPGDSTNLYYTVDSGAGTTISVWVTV